MEKVRSPADARRTSRSKPTAKLSPAPTATRAINALSGAGVTSHPVSGGRLSAIGVTVFDRTPVLPGMLLPFVGVGEDGLGLLLGVRATGEPFLGEQVAGSLLSPAFIVVCHPSTVANRKEVVGVGSAHGGPVTMLLGVVSRLVDTNAPKTSYCDLTVFEDALVQVPLGRAGGPIGGLGPLATLTQLSRVGFRRPDYQDPTVRNGSARSFAIATTGVEMLDPSRIAMVTLDGRRLRVAMVDQTHEFLGLPRQLRPDRIVPLLGGVLRPDCVAVRPGTLRDRPVGSGSALRPAPTVTWHSRPALFDTETDCWDDW